MKERKNAKFANGAFFLSFISERERERERNVPFANFAYFLSFISSLNRLLGRDSGIRVRGPNPSRNPSKATGHVLVELHPKVVSSRIRYAGDPV